MNMSLTYACLWSSKHAALLANTPRNGRHAAGMCVHCCCLATLNKARKFTARCLYSSSPMAFPPSNSRNSPSGAAYSGSMSPTQMRRGNEPHVNMDFSTTKHPQKHSKTMCICISRNSYVGVPTHNDDKDQCCILTKWNRIVLGDGSNKLPISLRCL